MKATGLIDAHLHVVDFLQEGDGLTRLLSAMDGASVERAVIFGMPVQKKWNGFDPIEPHYYLDDDARCYYYAYTDQLVLDALNDLDVSQRQRFAPLICGFNPTDRHGVDHIERLLARSSLWRGVGEVLLRHDELSHLTLEETARANHPALEPVYQLCAERGLPLLLHQNSSSEAQHGAYLYLHELQEALERHRDLTVVWSHCGLSRRLWHSNYHVMVESMLVDHPNLLVDASWIVYDEAMCSQGQLRGEWLELIERHCHRFMIGSDLIGHFAALAPTLARYKPLLGALSEPARERVARGNAARVFFGEGRA